jgi:hypothetical protein
MYIHETGPPKYVLLPLGRLGLAREKGRKEGVNKKKKISNHR